MFGFVPLAARGLYADGLSTWSLLCWRYLLALAIIFAGIRLARLRVGGALRHGGWRIAIVGATLGAAQTLCYFQSLQRLDTGIAVLLFYTFPVVTLGVERFCFKQRVAPAALLCVIVILAGAALIAGPGLRNGTIDPRGLAWAVPGPVIYAFYLAASARLLARHPPVRSGQHPAGRVLRTRGHQFPGTDDRSHANLSPRDQVRRQSRPDRVRLHRHTRVFRNSVLLFRHSTARRRGRMLPDAAGGRIGDARHRHQRRHDRRRQRRAGIYRRRRDRPGQITAVGGKAGRARRVIDADGLLVTSGWVDVHTHYDGQATWDPMLASSSWHGVTTILFGNCGVGFAPVRPSDRNALIDLMEASKTSPARFWPKAFAGTGKAFPIFSTRSNGCRGRSTSRRRCRTTRCASMRWAIARSAASGRPPTTSP
jgi:hypothetical protein